MTSHRTASIVALYDNRSETYDDSFHPRQAEDFVRWANLKPSQSVLDLACGTGLVAILAKREVGEQGRVVGVDLNGKMMDVARRKARRDGLDITFIREDITQLNHASLMPESGDGFDVITCASALVLLPSPQAALTHWSTYLAPGGRILVDVLAERSMVAGVILEEIAQEEGVADQLLYHRSWITSKDSLRQLLVDAGLTPERVFETASYATNDIDLDQAPTVLQGAVKYTPFSDLADPAMRDRVQLRFGRS